ncbi:MAG: signal peptidase I [Desulfotomaculum sp.]|nr:signal peptidase I [Desulfotomaculum sp.]
MLQWVFRLSACVFTIVLVIFITISLLLIFKARINPGEIPAVWGYKPMLVLTGSMEPQLQPGDMIIAKEVEAEKVQVGDIITYQTSGNILVTHRVVGICGSNNKLAFKTKGDANKFLDRHLVSPDQLVGAVAFCIPGVGWVAEFGKQNQAVIIFLVLLIVLLTSAEIKYIIINIYLRKTAGKFKFKYR